MNSESVGVLEAVELSRTYGRSHALRKASFRLEAGSVTAIIGANGAGKSTTFNLLARRIAPSSGRVLFDGKDLGQSAARRRLCGYLSHASFLYGGLTAIENLELVAGLYGVPLERGRLESLLERVGLSRAAKRPVRQFSRGMTQRLAIARLLLVDPWIWLLDEPASGLDDAGRRWLVEEVERLRDRGRIVAIASHSRGMVAKVSSHAVVLQKGRVVFTGEAEAGHHIDTLFAEYIG